MAEHVVKDVGLFDVVELVGAADELARGKTPVGQMIEEDRIRHQRRHRHDAPARRFLERIREPLEVWNPVGCEFELAHAVQEFFAGAAGQDLRLMLEQCTPDAVFLDAVTLPVLVDREVVADFGMFNAEFVERGHGRGIEDCPAFIASDSAEPKGKPKAV